MPALGAKESMNSADSIKVFVNYVNGFLLSSIHLKPEKVNTKMDNARQTALARSHTCSAKGHSLKQPLLCPEECLGGDLAWS